MPFTFNDRQKSVAFFLLTGVFFLLVMIVMVIQGSDVIAFKERHYTFFEESHGFNSGTAIKYKGFNVGKVKSITLTPDNQIRADFYIYKKFTYLIKSNCVLRVQSSLLGASNLILMVSSDPESTLLKAKSLVYSSDMPEGQKILNRYAIAAKATDELTGKVKLILDDVHDLKPIMANTLNNISKSMENISILAAGLRGTHRTAMSDEILKALSNTAEITANLKTISERLNSKDNSIGYVLNDSRALSGKIEKIVDNLNGVSEDLKHFSNNNLGDKKEIDKVIYLLKADLYELQSLIKSMQNIFGKPKSK